MRTAKWSLAWLVILCCLAVAAFAEEDVERPAEDRHSPEGRWVSVCLVAGGRPSCDHGSMIGIIIREWGRKDGRLYRGGTEWQFGGELSPRSVDSVWDTDKQPMWLDFDYARSGAGVSRGIYRFEGELLVRCSPPRRTENELIDFTSSKENRQGLAIYRHATFSDDTIGGHVRSGFPADAPMPEHWRVILEVENGVAVAPEGRTARIGGEHLLSGGTPLRGFREPPEKGQMIAFAYGAMLFSESPAWLDEVAVQDDHLVARTGVAKREGDCLLWVVSSTWRPARGQWTDYDDRPIRFTAGEGERQVLRVLYPILEADDADGKQDEQE